MTDIREVCQICYRSTSHKANPTLTPESKSAYDAGIKKKKCSACRQGWAPIRIAKDAGNGRWAEIRTRPRIPLNIDYQLCKSCQSRVECPKGLECSFAHSKTELAIWNAERQNQPRPAPPITGPYQYQPCKHILNTGTCPFGQRCTFAHSDEELKQWLHTQMGADMNRRFMTGAGYNNPYFVVNPPTEFKCDVCHLSCTSARQLEDHLAGTRHRQTMTNPGQAQPPPPPPGPRVNRHFRQRPTLAVPINGYRMCRHVQSGLRCIFGDFCTFAHNPLELDEWNKELQMAQHTRSMQHGNRPRTTPTGPAHPDHQPHPQSTDGLLSQSNTASGLDDFGEEESPSMAGQDFGAVVRDKILGEHNKKESLTEFEVTCEGVTVVEVTGRDLCLQWSQASSIEWVFEVTTTSPRTLHTVTLFDSFLTDFDISGAFLLTSAGQQKKLPGLGKCEKGVGLLLNQKFGPSEKIHIKVTLVPRSGLLGQLVVFDFGSFTMIRALAVTVLTKQESETLNTATAIKQKKPKKKPNLFWEHHLRIIPSGLFMEETDKTLLEYKLPEQIETFIEGGKYRNVEARVTRDNYQRRMHNLLYLEEYKQREDMSRYDLYDIEVTPQDHYTSVMGLRSEPGYVYIQPQLEEALFEGGRSVRMGDSALVWPSGATVVYECSVESVAKQSVVLKIPVAAKADLANARGKCSVRFQLGRVSMRAMHYAVDNLNLSIVFPESPDSTATSERPTAVLKCLEELKRLELNGSQQEAITSMLDPASTKIPSLVLGPFGCGKTRTLSECVKLLAHWVPEARVLICTLTNSAADLYVKGMDREWRERFNSKAPLLRIYYTGRKLETIPKSVQQYCKFDRGQLALPTLAELQGVKIVVATTMASRSLMLSKLPKDLFTHVFIDEAAQVLESECIIPLCLVGERTKVVLAGDHMQMDPPVYSPIARKYGLHVSLLERLYDDGVYESGVGLLCRTLLTENHRSHQQILELPSRLFYKNKLTCKAVLPSTGPQDIPPIKFVGVSGKEEQTEDSPSYYNEHEVLKVVEQVQQLVSGGLQASEICVLAYYRLQVNRIRLALRSKDRSLYSVTVYRIDDVQGQEFRALILSTVRTCSTEPPEEEETGFLTNPKMFNTAVTRAKQWLVVVGEPFTLCTVGENRLCWMEYIRCCQALGSFDYTNADQFVEESLDYKIVVRQLLEKVHSSFFNPNNPLSLTPTAYSQASRQKQLEMLRSKVKHFTVGGDDLTVKKITEELLKLSMEQQVTLIAKPDMFAAKVKEIEQVFRRSGPTTAILNSKKMEAPLISQPFTLAQPQAVPRPPHPQGSGFNGAPGAVGPNTPQAMPTANGTKAALIDLPPYLLTSMESVAAYARWVEQILRTPLVASQEIRENMMRQQVNVGHQLRLVNEQIYLYREVCKLMQQLKIRAQAPPPGAQHMATPPVTMGTNPAFVPPSTQPRPQMPPPQSQPYQLFSQPNANPAPQTVPNPQGVAHQTTPNPQGVVHQTAPQGVVHQTVPQQSHQAAANPQGSSMPGKPGNSAFTYGVSALLPNATDPLHSQTTQPSFVAGIVKGGRTMSPASSLGTAVTTSSTPSTGGHRNDQEVYISDEELFN